MTARAHETRFPGEATAYRVARDELLLAERALRRQIEPVAAQRRQLWNLFDLAREGRGESWNLKQTY